MKRTLIACTVLLALAFFVVPALAAPSPLHKVTWHGSGVSRENPSLSGEIIGNQVKFDGAADSGHALDSGRAGEPSWIGVETSRQIWSSRM